MKSSLHKEYCTDLPCVAQFHHSLNSDLVLIDILTCETSFVTPREHRVLETLWYFFFLSEKPQSAQHADVQVTFPRHKSEDRNERDNYQQAPVQLIISDDTSQMPGHFDSQRASDGGVFIFYSHFDTSR